jgi:hypothetical protein
MRHTTSSVLLVQCPECHQLHPQQFWGACEDNQNSYASKEEYAARHQESTQLVEVLEFV